MQYEEKRAFMRINVDCDMMYRVIDSSQFQQARCISLSGAGVSFVTPQLCDEGKAIEISITPQNSLTPSLTAFVEVIRVTAKDADNYEVAATIKSIKG
jgi:hypothetical protein